ncbi:hypothetical protein MTO96_043072 [Rhipicephalus appendiculatus]
MASTSTSSPDPGGRDDGREEARPHCVVATTSNRNATTRDESASGAAAPRSDDATPGARPMTAAQRYLHAVSLHQNCPILPPVKLIEKNHEELQHELEYAHIDMQRPCTMTDTEPCWVLYNLPTLNHILVRANIEITETEPSRLLVRTFHPDARLPLYNDGSTLLTACILLDFLFKGHRCVHELCLRPPIVDTWCAQMLSVSLASNTNIKHITTEGLRSLKYAPGHPLMSSICEMPALESVSITGLFLGERTATQLGATIATAKSLRSVNFMKNDMPPGAGEELMKAVCQNRNLEAVRLSYAAIGAGGASALGEYLATSPKLRYLSLLYLIYFDDEQMSSIIEGMQTNHGLENLHIEGVHVAPSSTVSFAEVLRSHRTLKDLTVTSCHLGEAEANSFAVLLEHNTTLLGLDLSRNEIGNIGAIRIARSLKINEHLQKLDLSKNCITHQGAAPLAEALASNRVLKELALWDVSDEKKQRPLASALSRNAVHGRVLLRHESIASVLQLATGVSQNADLVTVLHLDACVHVNAHCLKTLFVSLAAIPPPQVLDPGMRNQFQPLRR